jgi:hypothetical protein
MAELVASAAQLLRAGYGVEDIAVAHNFPVADLRVAVRWMRNTGQLRQALGLPAIPQSPEAGLGRELSPKDI